MLMKEGHDEYVHCWMREGHDEQVDKYWTKQNMGEAGTGILAQNKEKGDSAACPENVAMQYSSGTHWNGLITGVGVCVCQV